MLKLRAKERLRLEKAVLLLLMLLPLGRLVFDYAGNALGANPVETLTHRTGDWAIRILLLSLAVTPVQIILRYRRAILFRRLLGLTAFFYAFLHFGVYLVFDQELSFNDTLADVAKRPYITVGFAALMLLIPLAITSTDGMIKKFGAKRWRRLHQTVYVVAILAVIHYLWLVKADITAPVIYGVILAALFGLRLYIFFVRLRAGASRRQAAV